MLKTFLEKYQGIFAPSMAQKFITVFSIFSLHSVFAGLGILKHCSVSLLPNVVCLPESYALLLQQL